VLQHRERVEQGLRRMLVPAVAGVEHRDLDLAGELHRRAGRGGAQHDEVDAERHERLGRVEQRLALADRRALRGEVDDVRGEALRREVEAEARPRRVLEEEVADDAAAQRRDARPLAAGDRQHLARRVEQVVDLARVEVADGDEVGQRRAHRRPRRRPRRPRRSRRAGRRRSPPPTSGGSSRRGRRGPAARGARGRRGRRAGSVPAGRARSSRRARRGWSGPCRARRRRGRRCGPRRRRGRRSRRSASGSRSARSSR
jgi:hypothetical protein